MAVAFCTLLSVCLISVYAWYVNMFHSIINDEIMWVLIGVFLFPIGCIRGLLMLMGIV